VLIGSYENSINDILFQGLVMLSVARADHPLDDEGKVVLVKDRVYREFEKHYLSSDFRRKLDFISKLRFQMYNKDGA
jgi:hypothetical protein